MRIDAQLPLPAPESLPCEQPLEAHLSGVIAQDGVETQGR
jgi:hypothetical protein